MERSRNQITLAFQSRVSHGQTANPQISVQSSDPSRMASGNPCLAWIVLGKKMRQREGLVMFGGSAANSYNMLQ